MFEEALRRADIVFGNLTETDEGIITLGNGDMQAVLHREKDDIVIRLAKNDIWDRRLDTSKDTPLISIDELTEKILAEGDSFSDEIRKWISEYPSYVDHVYPCPVLCAKIQINMPESTNETHRLSLRKGALYSCNLCMRIDANHNCFVLENLTDDLKVSLIPANQIEMDAPETGEFDGIQYILQTLPEDIDVPAWYFAVAFKRIGGSVCASIATSQDKQTCLDEAMTCVKRFEKESFWNEHIRWWEEFWSVSGIELEDHFLESPWYRSLYLLACACRPGKTVPGLYVGISKDQAPWHGDYHWDWNMQMTFWGCYAANHPDLCEPYDTIVLSLLKRAEWLAEKLYNVEGAFFPVTSFLGEPEDPATCKANNNRMSLVNDWGRMLGNAGFVVQNLWRHYLFTHDRKLLEHIYPVLYKTAMFYLNYGKLYPSVSPEHWRNKQFLKT